MQPRLIVIGVAAIAIGVLVFILMVTDAARMATTPAAGTRPPGEIASDEPPSRFWAFAGGTSLAAGFALVGLGMNRWTASRRRRPQARG